MLTTDAGVAAAGFGAASFGEVGGAVFRAAPGVVAFFVAAGATALTGAFLAGGFFLAGETLGANAFFVGIAACFVGTAAFLWESVVFLWAAGLAAGDFLAGVATLALTLALVLTGAARPGAGFFAGAADRLLGAAALTGAFLTAGLLTGSPRNGGAALDRVPRGDGRSRFGRRGL